MSPDGVLVAHYERAGEVKTAEVVLETPSERELAREERMKREG